MKNYTVAVIVGSLRKDSLNKQLALALQKMAPAHVQFNLVEIGDLPLYNQDSDAEPVVPAVQAFRDSVRAADAVLLVTPEYNRSYPGVLKNALDQGSRPWGQSVWAQKPVAIVGMSLGAMGTAMAQQHLRGVVAFLDMPTLNQPEVFLQAKEGFFTEDGQIGEGSHAYMQKWMDAFVAHIARHTEHAA